MVYALVVLLASLNRVTGFVLVLIYAAAHIDDLRRGHVRVWAWTIIYGLVTTGVYVGLRLWRPDAEHVYGTVGTLQKNLDLLPMVTLHNLVMLPLWVAALAGYRYAPVALKRLFVIVVPLYMAAALVYGRWDEVRLQMTVAPILLALAACWAQNHLLGDK